MKDDWEKYDKVAFKDDENYNNVCGCGDGTKVEQWI